MGNYLEFDDALEVWSSTRWHEGEEVFHQVFWSAADYLEQCFGLAHLPADKGSKARCCHTVWPPCTHSTVNLEVPSWVQDPTVQLSYAMHLELYPHLLQVEHVLQMGGKRGKFGEEGTHNPLFLVGGGGGGRQFAL